MTTATKAEADIIVGAVRGRIRALASQAVEILRDKYIDFPPSENLRETIVATVAAKAMVQ